MRTRSKLRPTNDKSDDTRECNHGSRNLFNSFQIEQHISLFCNGTCTKPTLAANATQFNSRLPKTMLPIRIPGYSEPCALSRNCVVCKIAIYSSSVCHEYINSILELLFILDILLYNIYTGVAYIASNINCRSIHHHRALPFPSKRFVR